MRTTHVIYFQDSKNMQRVPADSIDLVVTSPPYPMIEMWDDLFAQLNPQIKTALASKQASLAFELMHKELEPVWEEVYRILKPGGLACLNIGDATRTINGDFALYTNHSRILSYTQGLGFSALPALIWRKQTNAPNKFMGSGMLPPGAYVTLEHEYILVLRKGSKMPFPGQNDKAARRESAFFWEERNNWYSDVWMDLKGAPQDLKDKKIRLRSGAFPFELPYRLINMFSVKGGTVLDPFLGTGTTTLAAMASGRHSLGFELNPDFRESIYRQIEALVPLANSHIRSRLENHENFVQKRLEAGYEFKYRNIRYGFPVMTSQETELLLPSLLSVEKTGPDTFQAIYSEKPQQDFAQAWKDWPGAGPSKPVRNKSVPNEERQLKFLDLDRGLPGRPFG